MNRRYALLIFDLDGTLIDSAPDICTGLALALAEVGLPGHDLPAVRQMIGEGHRVLVERAILRAGGDLGILEELLPRFRQHYQEHLLEKTSAYGGVRETVAALRGVIPMAVATNKPGAWSRTIVKGLGLAEAIPLVLGEDDVGKRKPDPLLLTEVSRRLSLPLSDALFVGDSEIDRKTAVNADVDMAYCTWGYGGARPLGEPAPRYVLSNLGELLDILHSA